MFESLLIANRGEIAVRIIRACRELGIRAIAIHSDADEGAMWTRLADEAHRVGPAPARESYLNIDAIVDVATTSRAQAVHPGYGLLSESSQFSAAVRAAGIAFVGPKPDTIALMGDKVAARHAAIASGVPVLPGSDNAVGGLDEAMSMADGIGWPIVVKASFGGGGRGMRVAEDKAGLAAALEQAGREANAAFGRGDVFLERYLFRPRHIEVQILADAHGNIIHVGDRDCSVQRRHQKLLEEAPAPALPNGLRARIHDAAVRLCRDVGYEGAGTVEFLADVASDEFYFLEMNTRLQVEHGVSELVTGIDLVKQQIRIASGAALGFGQADVTVRGHAIQARIAAEEAWEGFRPVPGRIDLIELPMGPWLRCDFGVEAGDSIQRHYDSMFGKVHAWGQDRDEARQRLAIALDTLKVSGVPTTAPYLRTLLDRPAFVNAAHDTGSLQRDWQPDPDRRPTVFEATAGARVSGASPRLSERRIPVPWGERSIDVTVYGVAGRAGEIMAVGGRAPRGGKGHSGRAEAVGPGVFSPMDAIVVGISCEPGQNVTKDMPLLILEAMKMEVVIASPRDGIVGAIRVKLGDAVKSGAELATIDLAKPSA